MVTDRPVAASSLAQLKNLCDIHLDGWQDDACQVVLSDPRFAEAPGGANHHHNYKGGLADHTLEVAEMAMLFCRALELEKRALIAAIFHDYGKVLEYKIHHNIDGQLESISTTPFKDTVAHIPYSWEFFRFTASEAGLDGVEIEEISHAILAHHGRKEWGSPVEPRTPLAFALHSADMLSMQGWRKQ
jgi:3'-5' exoribonuclease